MTTGWRRSTGLIAVVVVSMNSTTESPAGAEEAEPLQDAPVTYELDDGRVLSIINRRPSAVAFRDGDRIVIARRSTGGRFVAEPGYEVTFSDSHGAGR